MKFMLTFAWKPGMTTETRREGIARFLRGAGTPPEGARLVGRWTRADFAGGFDLIETDDARPLTEFAVTWNDVMDITIVPVVEDADLAPILKKAT